MSILFVGGYYPDDLVDLFIKDTKSGLDFAAQNLQEAIIAGFKANNQQLSVITAPFLGSFPLFSKKLIIPNYKSKDGSVVSVPYFNLSFVKRWDIRGKVWKEILKWLKKPNEDKFVIFYNFSCVRLSQKIKELSPNTKVCLLVTDLIEYMAADNSILSRLNNNLNSVLGNDTDYHNYIDGYILLSNNMVERLHIGAKPWIQMEGIYNSTDIMKVTIQKETHKTILYTGNLGRRYGIEELLNAFSLIKNVNYRLWIRGNGECEELVKSSSRKDERIVYFDKMSRIQLLQLEQKATVLVNPVKSDQDFSKYFFPSKTLEYMASGTPTLMCRLSCMPEDYLKHLYFFEDETIEGMSKRLIEICEKPQEELNEFGRQAADFIYLNKMPKMQVSKIISFLHTLL